MKSQTFAGPKLAYATKKAIISTATAKFSGPALHILVETVEPVKGALVELTVLIDGVALTGFGKGAVELLE